MIKASYSDKNFITDILADSFYTNSSVNYIIKQDEKKSKRIKNLMNYSFDLCFNYGTIYYTEDRKGCALIMFPDKRKNSLKSFLLDLKFVFSTLDIPQLRKAMARELKIKLNQAKGIHYYLWFIGVDPLEQGKGIGTALLMQLIEDSNKMKRPILLETSNILNVRWYRKLGFELYNTIDLGYNLYFLKHE